MAKSETVYTRLEPSLKADAERVLERLGLTPSEAINIFLNQVVLRKGLPFEVRLPEMSHAEAQACLMSKLKEAEDSVTAHGWLTAEESRRMLGV
jgi:addiction module RelB/DinJ family antitoxin